MLRPLRLFVAPNSLRACRIALLKVTHWPLVALILAYENGRRAVDRRGQADSSLTASAGAVSRSSLMRRPLSSRSVPRLKIKISDSPPGGKALTGQQSHDRPRSRTASSQNRIDTLEALAESLRLQLHSVDSMIESEKTQSSSLDA